MAGCVFRPESQLPLHRIECFRCNDKRWPVLFASNAGRQQDDLDELEADLGLPRARNAHYRRGIFFQIIIIIIILKGFCIF